MKTVLVTGSRGFTGHYAVKALEARGYRVVGLDYGASGEGVYGCDLTDPVAVKTVVEAVRPDYVMHLAGLAFVGHADEMGFYRVNLFGTQNLLQVLAGLDTAPEKVLLASSANVYGTPGLEVLDESLCPAPVNHYAMSKLAMEHMARTWFDRLPIVLARPFNYTGPGQDEKFLVPKIVAHFRRGAKFIELGNLDVSRDFSDVRDVMDAYIDLLECSVRSVAVNVCSGTATPLREVVAAMERVAGYSIEIQVNPAFVRANELPVLRGDNALLRQLTGRVPQIPLEETLRTMYQA